MELLLIYVTFLVKNIISTVKQHLSLNSDITEVYYRDGYDGAEIRAIKATSGIN